MSLEKLDKKTSIRQHVNESDIRFELYHMKYANQLKSIKTMSTQEIQEKWDYDNQKKINRFTKDLQKPEYQDSVSQQALKANIEYLKNLPAPISEDMIQENFSLQKEAYITDLENRYKDKSQPFEAQQKIKESLNYINDLELKIDPSKERFGTMLLLMIKNIRTMPSFSGYSENWATDFYSNAIEKILLYLDNFDVNLLSKRTGEKSKAFAYVTQICFNAFINIINIRKAEGEFLKDTISYETHNFDGVKNMLIQEIKDTDLSNEDNNKININSIYKIKINKKNNPEEIKEKISKGYEMIENINESLNNNRAIKQEIEYIKKNTSENDKNKDYYNYLEDLKKEFIDIAENVEKTILYIQVSDKSIITEISKLLNDIKNKDNSINLIVSPKTPKELFLESQKLKETKNNKKKSVNGYDYETGLTKKEQDSLLKLEADIMEENEFNNEW